MSYLILLWGIVLCTGGSYQLWSGRPTMMTRKMRKTFNLNESFVKIQGLLHIIAGLVLLTLFFYYKRFDGSIDHLYLGFIILSMIYCVEIFIVLILQKNIEGIPLSEILKIVGMILFICIIAWYCRPISLANVIKDSETVQVSIQEMAVEHKNSAAFLFYVFCSLMKACYHRRNKKLIHLNIGRRKSYGDCISKIESYHG